MKTLFILAGAAAVYMLCVYFAFDDPSAGQQRGWRACVNGGDGYQLSDMSCAPELFKTLAQCRAFNASEPYGGEAACYGNIDEVPESECGYATK